MSNKQTDKFGRTEVAIHLAPGFVRYYEMLAGMNGTELEEEIGSCLREYALTNIDATDQSEFAAIFGLRDAYKEWTEADKPTRDRPKTDWRHAPTSIVEKVGR